MTAPSIVPRNAFESRVATGLRRWRSAPARRLNKDANCACRALLPAPLSGDDQDRSSPALAGLGLRGCARSTARLFVETTFTEISRTYDLHVIEV